MPDVGISEYMRIRRYVMNLILRADGKAAQIPTIQELSEKFGVSRPTVSKAMKELTSEGYIIGKRGIGTFTNPAKRAMELTRLNEAQNDLVNAEMNLVSSVVKMNQAKAQLEAAINIR